MSTVNDILRRPVFKFDKLSDNLCAENMHLHGSIIQGSRYSKIFHFYFSTLANVM